MSTIILVIEIVMLIIGFLKSCEWIYNKLFSYFRKKIERDIIIKITTHPEFGLLSRVFDLRKEEREIRLTALQELIDQSESSEKN
jgi:hypothetical protein